MRIQRVLVWVGTCACLACSSGSAPRSDASADERHAADAAGDANDVLAEVDHTVDALADAPAEETCASAACHGRSLGSPCETAADCAGASCVDGVCCGVSACPTCQACNIDGHGTCSPVPEGPTAACPDDDSNCTRGCNGAGSCVASPSGAQCGPATCSNGSDSLGAVEHVGQHVLVSLALYACDGSSGGPDACQAQTRHSCPGNLTCATDKSCRRSCSTHADCLLGFFCEAASGACVQQEPNGTPCSDEVECASRVCSFPTVVMVGQLVKDLPGTCAGPGLNDVTAPHYAGDCHARTTIEYTSYPRGWLPCPVSAPDCGADGSCHCGEGAACPEWMVCVEGACKVAGHRPCLADADCAYGACVGGRCPYTQTGACTTDSNPWDSFSTAPLPNAECARGSCDPYQPTTGAPWTSWCQIHIGF